jgi:predicted nucleic acid-binding protein
MSVNRSILIDADVISHFISAGKLLLLPKIFPDNKILLLDKVYNELSRFQSRKPLIDRMLTKGSFDLLPFPDDNPDIRKEFVHIMKVLFKGEGESACMAVARFNNNIIASSNLKDIRQYCTLHAIDYLATMDFLCTARKRKILSTEECNEFIRKVIKSGSKLPVLDMKHYKCRNLEFIAT